MQFVNFKKFTKPRIQQKKPKKTKTKKLTLKNVERK